MLPLLIGLAYHVSVTRQVHGLPPGNMTYELQASRLLGVKVEPEVGRDLDDLLRYIEREIPADETLFYFGNRALIHGVVNRPSTQPLLWFREGVTYSERDASRSDQYLLDTLIEKDVHWLVIEDERYLRDFPRTKEYIEGNFKQVREVGLRAYFVYQRP